MSSIAIPSIINRRARRALSDRPIEEPVLISLIEAAHLAPSCANNQPWRFIVVNQPSTLALVKEQLSRGNYWAQPSPAIVAIASQADLDCQIPDGRDYYLFGCGMAAMNLMLQATACGLIAHPIAGFKQTPIKELLCIPDNHTLITLIILGQPASDHALLSEKHQTDETSERQRKPLPAVFGWNVFPSSEDSDRS